MALTRLAFEVHDLCATAPSEPRIEMPRETIAISVHIACSLWSFLAIYHRPRARLHCNVAAIKKKNLPSPLRTHPRHGISRHPIQPCFTYFPLMARKGRSRRILHGRWLTLRVRCCKSTAATFLNIYQPPASSAASPPIGENSRRQIFPSHRRNR